MNYEQAILDPASTFLKPFDVLEVVSFTREQKIKILRQWEYHAHELEVAEGEGMPTGPNSLLADVHKALESLDTDTDMKNT